MYPAFFYALRKPPAGRVGAYGIRPPTHAPVYGANTCSSCSNTVSSSFKHDSNVIQIRPCGPSVRAYAIRPYSGTRIMYPAFLAGVPDASGLCRGWETGRVPQKPVPSKLRRRPQTPRGLGKCQNAPLNVSEGRQGRQPSWPGTSNVYPDRFAGVRRRPEGSESVKTRR